MTGPGAAWPGWVKAVVGLVPTDRDGVQRAPLARIPRGLLPLWLALARFANKAGTAWPSRTTLATLTGRSVRAVTYSLAQGERAGLWTRESRRGGGRSSTTRYRLQPVQSVAPVQPASLDQCNELPSAGEVGCSQNKAKEQSQRNKATKRGGDDAPGKALPSPTFPPPLDTPEFREAWGAWERHRQEIRRHLTPSTVARQLKALETWGLPAALGSIEQSIRNGWTGLFPPRPDRSTTGPAKPPAPDLGDRVLRLAQQGKL